MEIERKFLFRGKDAYSLPYTKKYDIIDQYLSNTLRVRNINNQQKWIITNKGSGTIKREEIEIPIYVKPYFATYKFPMLSKTRLIVPFKGNNFEVNVFNNIAYKKKQLILVELELSDENQVFQAPKWLGQEVTEDERFYGKNLVKINLMQDFSII